jgi:hypothetical protein
VRQLLRLQLRLNDLLRDVLPGRAGFAWLALLDPRLRRLSSEDVDPMVALEHRRKDQSHQRHDCDAPVGGAMHDVPFVAAAIRQICGGRTSQMASVKGRHVPTPYPREYFRLTHSRSGITLVGVPPIRSPAGEGSRRDDFELFCECGQSAPCRERVRITRATFERVRSDPTTFIVFPGHEAAAVENTIERGDGFVIARNLGRAAEIARAADPRRMLHPTWKPRRVVLEP